MLLHPGYSELSVVVVVVRFAVAYIRKKKNGCRLTTDTKTPCARTGFFQLCFSASSDAPHGADARQTRAVPSAHSSVSVRRGSGTVIPVNSAQLSHSPLRVRSNMTAGIFGNLRPHRPGCQSTPVCRSQSIASMETASAKMREPVRDDRSASLSG
jgi:hypothetical protein